MSGRIGNTISFLRKKISAPKGTHFVHTWGTNLYDITKIVSYFNQGGFLMVRCHRPQIGLRRYLHTLSICPPKEFLSRQTDISISFPDINRFLDIPRHIVRNRKFPNLQKARESSQNGLWRKSRVQNGSPRPEEFENGISWPIRDEFPAGSAIIRWCQSWPIRPEFVPNRPENTIFEFFRPRRPI